MANQTAVRVDDAGKGSQVVVLLHGYLESLEVWDTFAGELGKKYRVIRLDLPGHGFSQWAEGDVIGVDYMGDTVAAMLDQVLEPGQKYTVVGHSMGGYVAVSVAVNHPERVEGLVLFHSSPNGDTPEKAENRQREIEIVEAGKKEMLARVNPGKGFAPDNLRKCRDTIEELAEQVMLTEDQAVVAVLKGMAERPDRSAAMRESGVPQLMIFGRADNYIPVEAAQAMAQAQPQAEVAWLDHSGHMGFVEQPVESIVILDRFLEKVAAQS